MDGENKMHGQKAVGYVRVSGKGQVNGTGPDRQREAINAYAAQSGLAVATIYEETYTGTEADRPMFTEMLRDLLTNGCRTILVENLDRFARDLSVQLQLTALLASRGLVLVNATTGQDVTAAMQQDPMTRAMIQVQAVFSELDKRLTVAKLRKARQLKRRKTGRCEGRRPFGSCPGEADTLRRMRELNDGRTFYGVAAELNRQGLASRTGKPWTPTSVRRILSRPLMAD
jgi:DNA invertase Pin-like site-specific DNA recombinase